MNKLLPVLVVLGIVFFIGCIGEDNTGATGQAVAGEQCNPNWQCNDWGTCTIEEKQTRTCYDSNTCGVSTDKPIEIRTCTLSNEDIKRLAKASVYDDLFRNNENYVGSLVYFKGEIVQVINDYANADSYFLRITTQESTYGGYSGDDVIWVNYRGTRVLEGDIIEVWGKITGLRTYTAVWGNEITIPEIDAKIVEVTTAPKEASISDSVKIISHRQDIEDLGYGFKYLYVRGTAQNIGQTELSFVTVKAKFFDVNNIQLYTGISYMSDVAAGAQWNFEIMYAGSDVDKVNHYEVFVE